MFISDAQETIVLVYGSVISKLKQWNSSDVSTVKEDVMQFYEQFKSAFEQFLLNAKERFEEFYGGEFTVAGHLEHRKEQATWLISTGKDLVVGHLQHRKEQVTWLLSNAKSFDTSAFCEYLSSLTNWSPFEIESWWMEIKAYWTEYKYEQMISKEYLYWAYSIWQSTWASLFRLNCAVFLAPGASQKTQPAKPLILYDCEGSSYCKMVRETACVLGLDVVFKPCPKKGTVFCKELEERAGKVDLPYLVDENKEVEMGGYEAIETHLFETYGANVQSGFKLNKMLPFRLMHGPLYFTIFISSFIRSTIGYGRKALPTSTRPQKALTLWGNEHSPFVTIVRELLCSFEIPYVMKNTPIGCTWKREEFRRKHSHLLSQGRNMVPHVIQIPLLIDPNTDTTMVESRAICKYLWDTYGEAEAEKQSEDLSQSSNKAA